MKHRSNMKTGRLIRDIILIVFAVSFLLPLYWMLTLSVKDANQAASVPWALPSSIHPENFSEAWNRMDIARLFKNSSIYTFGGLILSLVLSVMVAYALTRMYMRHAETVKLYFTIGMLIPVAVLLIPVYRTVIALGLKGTHLTLILPYAAFSMSSAILMISAFFRSIPREMEEAAAIDGGNVFRVFLTIMVPLVKPAIVTQAMFMFINNWNEYALASVLALGEKMRTIPLALNLFFGKFDITNWGVVGAAVTITSMPIIIVFIFCNHQIENAMLGTTGLK